MENTTRLEVFQQLEPVLPRVRQLLTLLGSEHDGEVVAASRALICTLGTVGCDLHTLTAALLPAGGPFLIRLGPAPSWQQMSTAERADALDRLLREEWLTRWERQLAVTVRRMLDRRQITVPISDRLVARLDELFDAAGIGRRAA